MQSPLTRPRILMLALGVAGALLVIPPCHAQPLKKLRVALALGEGPLGATIDEHDMVSGLTADLTIALGSVMGQQVVFSALPRKDTVAALLDNQVDAITTLTDSESHPGIIETKTYASSNDAFFRRASDAPLVAIAQAITVNVGAIEGDLAAQKLQVLGAGTVRASYFQTFSEALQRLNAGEVDAVLCPLLACTAALRRMGLHDQIQAGPPLLEYVRLHRFSVKEGNEALRDKLDAALLEVMANGTYEKLGEKWLRPLAPKPPPSWQLVVGATWLVMMVLVGLVVWAERTRRLSRKLQVTSSHVAALSAAFANADNGILVLDRDGDAVWANPAYFELTGATSGCLGQPGIESLLRGTTDTQLKAAIAAALMDPAPWHTTFSLATGFGKRTVRLSLTSVCDVAGHRQNTVCTLTDLTDLEQNFSSIQKTNERWHFILEGVGQGFWDWCPDQHSLYVSKAWKQMLGYGEHEFEDTFETWLAAIHPDDSDAFLAAAEAHLRNESDLFEAEHRLRHKNGSYITVLSRGKVFHPPEDPTASRLLGTTTDISPIKQAEAAARYTTDLFHILVDAAIPDAMLVCAQDGLVVDASVRACALLGFTREELTQFNIEYIEDIWSAPGHQNRLRGLQNGAQLTYETTYRRKDGSQFPAEVRVGHVQSAGRRFYVLLARDISARAAGRLAQELHTKELRHNEEAMRAIMNSLPIAVALVNELGIVGHVNLQWTKDVDALADMPVALLPEGANFVDTIERRAAAGDHDAGVIVAGIRHITQGKLASFSHSYKVADKNPVASRWFLLTGSTLQNSPRSLVLTHRETTDLQRALAKAKDFERMATAVAMPLYLVDTHLRIVASNDAGARTLGKYSEELRGTSLAEVMPVDIIELVIDHATKALGGQEHTARLHRQKYDGTLEVADLHCYPVRGSQGRVGGVVLALDEKTHVELALRALDNYATALAQEAARLAQELCADGTLLAAAFRSSAFTLVALNANGRVVAANKAFFQATGYSEQQVIGQSLHGLVHTHELAQGQSADQCVVCNPALVMDQPTHLEEAVFRGVTGTPIFLQAAIRSLPAEDSRNPPGSLVVALDITILKNSSAALQGATPTARQLADTLPAFILVFDANGRGVYASSSWTLFTGQTPRETLGDSWLTSVVPDHRERAKQTLLMCVTSKTDADLFCQVCDRDGKVFDTMAHISPRIADHGELLGCQLIMTIVGRETEG